MHIKDKIKEFNESENFWVGILRDFLFMATVVAIFSLASYLALGRAAPMVAVETGSMIPNIQIGDIVFVESINRTEIITYSTGKETDYASFGDYGDVILYRKSGKEGSTPIIHRARYYVEAGEPMWPGGPAAPHAGYITKGDNNALSDQQGSVSKNQPVKREWVIGTARFFRIPLMGYISLIPRKILRA